MAAASQEPGMYVGDDSYNTLDFSKREPDRWIREFHEPETVEVDEVTYVYQRVEEYPEDEPDAADADEYTVFAAYWPERDTVARITDEERLLLDEELNGEVVGEIYTVPCTDASEPYEPDRFRNETDTA